MGQGRPAGGPRKNCRASDWELDSVTSLSLESRDPPCSDTVPGLTSDSVTHDMIQVTGRDLAVTPATVENGFGCKWALSGVLWTSWFISSAVCLSIYVPEL